jgi:uncharacterized membrane protein
MASSAFFQSFIILHLIGFLLFAGTTIADFILFKQFWKQYEADKAKATVILEARSKFPMLMGIGILLIIISGIGMMALTHGVFGEQLWFRIKFGLVIILILNGVLVGREQGIRLLKILNSDEINIIEKIKRNLNVFHCTQLVLFFTVLLLSIFKFN